MAWHASANSKPPPSAAPSTAATKRFLLALMRPKSDARSAAARDDDALDAVVGLDAIEERRELLAEGAGDRVDRALRVVEHELCDAVDGLLEAHDRRAQRDLFRGGHHSTSTTIVEPRPPAAQAVARP